MKSLPVLLLLTLLLLASCRIQPVAEVEKAPCFVRQNANLELYADSVDLELLPVKNTYVTLRCGDHVAVAEWEIHSEDSIDSVWVKVVHNAELQGWISQKHLNDAFVPTDSISQFIHFFSGIHSLYFVVPFLLYIAFALFRMRRKKPAYLPVFRDIDSLYPLSLCLFISIAAVIYAAVQSLMPELWLVYYYNPTLSPFDAPGVLALFLISLWLALVAGLAAVDDVFRKLPSPEALLYLVGLTVSCLFCYILFVTLTEYYIGYVLLLVLVVVYVKQVMRLEWYRYRCGRCGQGMKGKGVCPRCGAVNE